MENGAFTLAPFDSDVAVGRSETGGWLSAGGQRTETESRPVEDGRKSGGGECQYADGSSGDKICPQQHSDDGLNSTLKSSTPGRQGEHMVGRSADSSTTALEMKARQAAGEERHPLCACEDRCPCVVEAGAPPPPTLKLKSWSGAKSAMMAAVLVGIVAVCVIIVVMGHFRVL